MRRKALYERQEKWWKERDEKRKQEQKDYEESKIRHDYYRKPKREDFHPKDRYVTREEAMIMLEEGIATYIEEDLKPEIFDKIESMVPKKRGRPKKEQKEDA